MMSSTPSTPSTPDTRWFIDLLAENVHDRWLAGRLAQSVTSRLAEDGEELCVSYDELSESAKELDRETVRSVLFALGTLGVLL